jgi:hypothetical protein
MVRLLALLLALCSAQCSSSSSMPADEFSVDVDYGAFLERSDLVWVWDGTDENPVPNGWWSMGFTGNGLLVRSPPLCFSPVRTPRALTRT